MVTTGPHAERFAEAVAEALSVPFAIPVSSCTSGLLLAFQAMGIPRGAEVLIPSFTFMASGLAPVWNQCRPRFIDVDIETMNVDPETVEREITPETRAIVAVHQFGNPAPVEELEAIASRRGVSLLFDSAHGLGSLYRGKPLGGGGRAEVFSLTPTKLVIAAEGGVVATRDAKLAEHVRLGRNYGNPGDYDCLFPGLNARMSELHAVLGLHSLHRLEDAAAVRNRMASRMRDRLAPLPGVSFQKIDPRDRSSYKDFCIILDPAEFGLDAHQLGEALRAEGIQTRVYYSPVLHQMTAFQSFVNDSDLERLPNSIALERRALSLPMYSNMTGSEADLICAAIERIHRNAATIAARLS